MAYIYPLNNPGGVHLTVFDFTHLSHTPSIEEQGDTLKVCLSISPIVCLFDKPDHLWGSLDISKQIFPDLQVLPQVLPTKTLAVHAQVTDDEEDGSVGPINTSLAHQFGLNLQLVGLNSI